MAISPSIRLGLLACFVVCAVAGIAVPGATQENRGSCSRFAPPEPDSSSKQKDEARAASVVRVDDDVTKKTPVEISFDLGKSIWWDETPVVEDTYFANVQVTDVQASDLRLVTKLVWDSPNQLNDLDLLAYDSSGGEVSRSDRPTGQAQSAEILLLPFEECDGFTIEVRGMRTLETAATLRVWLAEPPPHYSCDC